MYTYRLAGVYIVTSEKIPQLPSEGITDALANILFFEPNKPPPTWYPFPPTSDQPYALISPDGMGIILRPTLAPPDQRAVLVRQIIPFASALQNKIILHAAAIRIEDSAYAFVGASGVGKSTLAEEFAKLSVTVLSDDLLPVRSVGHQVVAFPSYIPLKGIYFLERASTFQAEKISAKQYLQSLLQHGFGEVPAPSAWQNQFEFYKELIQVSYGYQLHLADDVSQITANAERILELLTATGKNE